VTATITRALIALSITLAALMLIGFLWIVNLGMEETSVSTVTRGGDRLRIRPQNAVDSGTRTNIPASIPGRCRGSAPGRIDPVTQLRPWLISFAVFAVTLVAFAAFASALMNE
jgi:hypothetical protein